MANPNHLDNFSFSEILDPPPSLEAGFSNVLMIVELATSSLDGDGVRTYTSKTGMDADVTAGFLDAAVATAGGVAFKQRPAPAQVVVASWDRVGVQTAAALMTVIDNTGVDYYGVCAPELRTDSPGGVASDSAFLDDLAVEIGARRKILCVQSPDAELLTTGAPSTDVDLANIFAVSTERTMIMYHSDDTEYADVAYLANRLAFSADELSVPWDAPVAGVTPYISATTSKVLNDTEKGFLDANNVNHGLELGSENFFVDPGVMLDGVPVYEVLSRDWFIIRLQERMANLKNRMSKRGQKITIDGVGQALVLAEVEGLMDFGSTLSSPHFEPGQTTITALPITTADRDAQRLRFTGAVTFAVSGRIFTFTLNFTRQLIFVEAA